MKRMILKVPHQYQGRAEHALRAYGLDFTVDIDWTCELHFDAHSLVRLPGSTPRSYDEVASELKAMFELLDIPHSLAGGSET